jgi:valyl-tRNA synthetase
MTELLFLFTLLVFFKPNSYGLMSEIPKAYEPHLVEDRWYSAWKQNGAFRGVADPDKEPYSIVIPPPNVTGVLHMGHLLNNTVQDIFIRRARIQGKAALWLPGTDHAGLATQTRVEKQLRSEGKSRHDLGRDAFVERAKAWRDDHGGIIFQQLERLGCSCDWDRNVHTLDEDYSEAVLTAFVQLYRKGMIYRGNRMVNWCPASMTALSDEEVIMKPQTGLLYRMRYEIVEHPGEYLEIATTRPETIMGDTGVAVHPDDERYRHLVGKQVWRPFPREPIPIVADPAVDIEFGTGVLKVTPAHDQLDWEIGQRHGLPHRDVLTPDGHINELGEPFTGMERFAARKAAAKKLEEIGALVKKENYENNVGFSERADVPIEPRLSEQWFMKYPKVGAALETVEKDLIRVFPERWKKTYSHWLTNINDWTISRQIWWGHRIPVWYKKGADRNDPANHHVSLHGPDDPENWEQDDDVLDTWASSWLWPFATLGWPDKTAEHARGLAYFYPTSLLVTGFDIIFFWVARMIMAGLEFMGEDKENLTEEDIRERIPFKDVYFTGLIRDIQGRKMSKSLGNSPDALELLDKYGADGVRLGLVSIAPKGLDILFAEERLEPGRNFCNKLWNVCRFRQMSGDIADNHSPEAILETDPGRRHGRR